MIFNKRILIITSSFDLTVSYIIKQYLKVSFFRFNVDQLNEYKVNITNQGWSISHHDEHITNNDVHSIYYRKPTFPDLSEYEESYHSMIHKDILTMINGIVDGFPGKVITKPYILRLTENKVFQLLKAAQYGFIVPSSYIGNDQFKANKYNQGIIKPLSTGKVHIDDVYEIYQTNIFQGINEDISLTPIYVQEYIKKQYEVRLTIIDQYVYAVRIDTIDQVDWRNDYEHHHYTLIKCPEDIIRKCYNMMEDFHIVFGAFDFIVTPNNEWVFLEVNPNGQWLWLEESLHLDISQKIAEYLSK